MKETVSMGNQRELTVLLIEDDKFACEEIRNYIDQLDDMRLLGITDDSNKALDMVKYCVPDAIILDLELHEGGGNGLFFLSKLHDLGLEKLPYILITTQNTSNVTLEAARQLGADFIITKYERDYSAQKPVELLRMMRNAINRAWSNGNPEDLARNYTAVINYERGVPTLTEFIYHYANRFRNEL